MRTFHLRRILNQWQLIETGKKEVLLHFDFGKRKAIITSKKQLKQMATHENPISFRICKLDGSIQTEYTYPRSADPIKSKG